MKNMWKKKPSEMSNFEELEFCRAARRARNAEIIRRLEFDSFSFSSPDGTVSVVSRPNGYCEITKMVGIDPTQGLRQAIDYFKGRRDSGFRLPNDFIEKLQEEIDEYESGE